MTSYVVTIHQQGFILSETQVGDLRRGVVDAAAIGGGFVDFDHEEGAASVWASPHLVLVIRGVPRADIDVEGGTPIAVPRTSDARITRMRERP